MEKFEYKIINGKPHFGKFVRLPYVYLDGNAFSGNLNENPIYQEGIALLEEFMNKIPKDFEIRKKQFIERPPSLSGDCLNQRGVIGYKFLLWGRAFKVMRYIQKAKLP